MFYFKYALDLLQDFNYYKWKYLPDIYQKIYQVFYQILTEYLLKCLKCLIKVTSGSTIPAHSCKLYFYYHFVCSEFQKMFKNHFVKFKRRV